MNQVKTKGGRPKKAAERRKSGRPGLYEYKAAIEWDKNRHPTKYKSFYSPKSKADAKVKSLEYLQELGAKEALGPSVKGNVPLLANLARKWLTVFKEGLVKDNTYRGTYENPVEKHVIPEFGNRSVDDVRMDEVQTFLNRLGEEYTGETLKKIWTCLKSIFDYAIEEGFITRNPARGLVKLPAGQPGTPKDAYSEEEYDHVLEFAKSSPEWLDIRFMLETGVSRSELLGKSRENITDKKQITVDYDAVRLRDKKTGRLSVVLSDLKNDHRSRTIPITKDLYECLKSLPKTITVQGIEITPKTLFCSPEGEVWDPDNWNKRHFKAFMKAMNAATGIKMLNPHELRHTFATLLLNRNVERFFIEHILGWIGEGMLDKVYGHYDPEVAREKLGWY